MWEMDLVDWFSYILGGFYVKSELSSFPTRCYHDLRHATGGCETLVGCCVHGLTGVGAASPQRDDILCLRQQER